MLCFLLNIRGWRWQSWCFKEFEELWWRWQSWCFNQLFLEPYFCYFLQVWLPELFFFWQRLPELYGFDFQVISKHCNNAAFGFWINWVLSEIVPPRLWASIVIRCSCLLNGQTAICQNRQRFSRFYIKGGKIAVVHVDIKKCAALVPEIRKMRPNWAKVSANLALICEFFNLRSLNC